MEGVFSAVQEPFDFGQKRGNPIGIPLINLPGQGQELAEVMPSANREYPYNGWHTLAIFRNSTLHRRPQLSPLRERIEHEINLFIGMRRHHGDAQPTAMFRDRWRDDRVRKNSLLKERAP
jgi:hypothetical protein